MISGNNDDNLFQMVNFLDENSLLRNFVFILDSSVINEYEHEINNT